MLQELSQGSRVCALGLHPIRLSLTSVSNVRNRSSMSRFSFAAATSFAFFAASSSCALRHNSNANSVPATENTKNSLNTVAPIPTAASSVTPLTDLASWPASRRMARDSMLWWKRP